MCVIFSQVAGELYENAADLAVQVANSFNPIKGLTEGAQIYLDIKEATKKLMKSGVVGVSLARAMAELFPKVEKMKYYSNY